MRPTQPSRNSHHSQAADNASATKNGNGSGGFMKRVSSSRSGRIVLAATLAIAVLSVVAVGSNAAGGSFVQSVKTFFGVQPTQTAIPVSAVHQKQPHAPLAVTTAWDFSPLPGGATNFGTSPLAATSSDSNMTAGGLTRGVGIGTTGTGAANAWGGTDFITASPSQATAIASNEFATFTITANAGFTVSLSDIAAYNIRRSATGPTTGIWQYQIGAGAFTDVGSAITWGAITTGAGNPQSAINLSGISALQNVPAGTTITLRVVTWGATGAAGTWYLNDPADTTVNDLIVNGTTAVAPKYRSRQTGNWNDFNTWDVDAGSGFVPAISGQTPSSADDTIQIQGGHTVTVTANVTADQLSVVTNGTLSVNDAIALSLNDGSGTDLIVSGTLNVIDTGVVSGAAQFSLGAGGTLGIGSAAGITNAPSATGSIQTSTRSFDTNANYTYNGSAAQVTGSAFPSPLTGTLTIDNSAGVTLSFARTLQNTLALTNGTLNLNTLTLTLSSAGGGITANSGARTISNGLLSVTGSKTVSQTGGGSVVFGCDIALKASMDFGAGLSTVNALLTLNAGGSVSTNAPTYGNASTLQYNTGSGFTVGTEWLTGTSGAGVPQNVGVHSSGTNVSFGSIATSRTVRGNLLVGVNGATLTLSTVSGGDLNVNGNFTMSGIYNHNGRTLTFNGTGAQAWTDVSAPPSDFGAVVINNSGSGVTLTNRPEVQTLTLTLGNVTTTGAHLLTVTNTSTGAISGGSATSYINGPLDRRLPASLAAGSVYWFPVGKTSFHPYELVDPTTNASGTTTLRGEAFDGSSGGSPGTGLSALNTNLYWRGSVSTGAANFTGTKVRLTDPTVTATNRIGKAGSQAGPYNSIGGTVAGSTITSDTFTSFSFFNIGTVGAPLTGSINVGSGETYTSLTNEAGLFQVINNNGLSGSLTVNITSDLAVESGTYALNEWIEVGAGNYTLTIKPSGASRAITGTATAVSVIKLNGADRVTIDGSLSGGTDRSLTISSTNVIHASSEVILIGSLGPGAGATNDTIKNCIIRHADKGTSLRSNFGISAIAADHNSGGADNDNLTIQNNQFLRARIGLEVTGPTGNPIDNLLVQGNSFGDAAVDANSLGASGLEVGNCSGANITGNTIQNVNVTDTLPLGMYLFFGFINASVTHNSITNIRYTGVNPVSGNGIYIQPGNSSANLMIANNVISDIKGNGASPPGVGNTIGIAVINGGGMKIYDNSVNLGSGTFAGASIGTNSEALYVSTTVTNLDVRGNIFANNLDNTGAAGDKAYAIYSQAPASAFTNLDNNDYFASGPAAVLGFIGGSDQTTITAWRTATGQDNASIVANPQFASATDLHITRTSPGVLSPVENAGVTLAGITTDYEGDTRDASTPEIGADELISFQLSSATYSIAENGAPSVTITVTRSGGSSVPATINYATSAGTATPGVCGIGSADYVESNGTLNFTAGQTSSFFSVPICDDAVFEADETVDLSISSPTGGSILGSPNSGVLTITNDDAVPATLVVTKTADTTGGCLPGDCSLRAAINAANSNPVDANTINFNIPNTDPNFSGGVYTITPLSQLPALTASITIDGGSQTLFGGDTNTAGPEVALSGAFIAVQPIPFNFVDGLILSGGSDVVKGLIISGFNTAGFFNRGILINSADNTVQGNYIGTNAAGTTAVPNGDGILINNSVLNNTIGGTGAGQGNLISGNTARGIVILAGTNDTTIRGNFIGTNAAGRAAVANGNSGIEISGNSSQNTIGSFLAGSRNIISGNLGDGVKIDGTLTGSNLVQGNYIGTDITGTLPIGNAGAGVRMSSGAINNSVGGLVAGTRNVISANGSGVLITLTGTTSNHVIGNYIGTDVTGMLAIGNLEAGVDISGGATNNNIGDGSAAGRNVISGNSGTLGTPAGILIRDPDTGSNSVLGNYIGVAADGTSALGNTGGGAGGSQGIMIMRGAANNVIGGLNDPGEANIIANNSGDGIQIWDDSATLGSTAGNTIRGNTIYGNTFLGINLMKSGEGAGVVTANDGQDVDDGPNGLQNFPIITTAVAGSSTVSGTLNSTPSAQFDIDVYSNTSCDGTNGEGRAFLGTVTVNTDGNGDAPFSVGGVPSLIAGQVLTATATVESGDTSEFSACFLVTVVGETDVTVSGGNLVITDAIGGDTADTLTISLNGANVRINDPNNTLTAGVGATQIDPNTVEVPLASISGNIQVNTLGANDTLTLALAGGDFIPAGGVTYAGGPQTSVPGDKLVITGGSQGSVTYNYTNANDGSIVMSNFGTVNYTGLEPITNSGTAADVIFNLPAGPNAATLADDGTGGNTLSTLSAATFEATTFANPTGSVTINRGNAADTLAVNALPDLNSSLTIGTTANPFSTITFNGAITLAANKNLSVESSSTISLSGASSDLLTSGTGTISLKTARNVTLIAGSSLETVNGGITVEANQQAGPTAGNFVGLDIAAGALVRTTGSGNIGLLGKGGADGPTANHRGIRSLGTITSTSGAGGAGTVTLNGVGGPGISGNTGVEIIGGAILSSVNGNVSLTGQGAAATGSSNFGVTVLGTGTVIQSTGTATVTLMGTGGAGTLGNSGVNLDLNANVTSAVGDIQITGQGTGSSASNIGVIVNGGAAVSSTGAAKVTISGTGGSGGTTALVGVNIQGVSGASHARVTSAGGDISITGVAGGGSGSSNIGVLINSGGAVTATGVATITIAGTGSIGTSVNPGVYVDSFGVAGTAISAVNGNISITGVSTDATGTDQDGVHFGDSSAAVAVSVTTTGTGTLAIIGTAGNNDATSAGINLVDDTTMSLTGVVNTFIADTMDIGSSAVTVNAGANAITLRQNTTNKPIDLGGADSATQLGLTDAELDRFTAATLNIGNAGSGTITVSADVTRPASTDMLLVSNGDVTISGGQINTGGGIVFLDPGTSPAAVKPTKSGTDVTVSTLSFGSDLAIVINGTTVDTQYTQLNVVGAVNLKGVDLVLSGTHTPVAGQTFTIVNNDLADAITGTFNGLPEGATIANFLGSPLSASITYVGGSGNDVVLTVNANNVYTWTATVNSDWQVPLNWTPARAIPQATDILLVDGTSTPGPIITNIPTQTVAAFRILNGAFVTLNAASLGQPHTLTINGATGADFTVPVGSFLTLDGSTGLTIKLVGSGTVGIIGGGMAAQGSGFHRLFGDAGGGITFQSGASFATGPGFTNNPFGTGTLGDGQAGSVIFASGSTYSHNAGASPFGTVGNGPVVTFQTGSLARWFSNSGFQASDRTYANLQIGAGLLNAFNLSDSGTGNFQFDKLDIKSTSSATSSLTYSGSGTASITIRGDITSTGAGNTGTLPDLTLTPGSGGTHLNKNGGGTLILNATGNSRAIDLEGGATVENGTTMALSRVVLLGLSNPHLQFLTIDTTADITGGPTGYVVGSLARVAVPTGSSSFPVGTAGEYSPVDLDNASGGGSLTVVARTPQQPVLTAGTSLQRYWSLTQETGALTTDLTFHYLDGDVAGDENGYQLVIVEGGNATSFPNSCPNTCVDPSANTIHRSGVSTFSDWTAAEPAAPTAVKLTGFSATRYENGEVQLNWQSGYEVRNLGYIVYREVNGKRVAITPSLIAGSALMAGSQTQLTAGMTYSWVDKLSSQQSAVNNQRLPATYWLEDVDLDGTRTLHGPIAIAECGVGIAGCAKIRAHSPLLNELGDPQSAIRNQQSGKPAAMTMPDSATGEPDPLVMQRTIAGLPGLKISVSRPGWYRITQPQVLAAGFNIADANGLQLYRDGRQVAFRLSNSTEQFGPSDYLEFYGEGLSSTTASAQTYYLVKLAEAGKRIEPKEKVVGPGDRVSPQGFAYTVERKERMIYFPSLLNGDEENFFGQVVSSAAASSSTLLVSNLDLLAQSAGSLPQLEVVLQGVTGQAHQVQVRVNGTNLGTMGFADTDHPSQTFSVPAGVVHDGTNTVELTALDGAADLSLIDVLRLTYVRSYEADNNALAFNLSSRQTKRLTGFTTDHIRVVDVSDPYNVLELTPDVAADGAGFAALIGVDREVRAPFSRPHELLAFADGDAQTVDAIHANEASSWWSETAGADYLIVTTPELKASVEPLAQLRAAQGLVVKVIDVEDLYDENTFGAHSPQALHDFLAKAITDWTRKPHYVVFAGDASYDPKNYLGLGLNDLVPTKLIDTSLSETASDDWLADSNNDGLADFAIGRLPVRTATEMNALVAKIVNYENAAPDPSRGALLVSDNGFEAPSTAVQSLLPAGMTVATINRSSADDATIHNQIIAGINQGPRVINYIGHGSNGVWTGASLLSSHDAPNLTNTNRLSVFTMMTCYNGYFQDASNDSLSEALLKAPGGAVAVWASTTLTQPAGQNAIDQQFYRMLFGAQPATLGDAAHGAKLVTGDADVRRTWTLFGDPAMRLR